MRNRIVRAVAVAALVFAMPLAAQEPVVRIGIVVDGPWDHNDMVRELTVTEIKALTDGEFEVRFPDEAYVIGDWTYEKARANIRRLLDDPDVDLVLTWGLLSSHAICCFGNLPKPVIAPVVLDPLLQGLPYENGRSGVSNLNYVSLPDTLKRQLEVFRGIVPFDHVAIVTNGSLLETIPEIIERTALNIAGTGVGFEYVAATESADEVLSALSDDVEAVYVWPLFQFSDEEYRKLIEGFIARKLPSFSGLGGGDVEAGMLATVGSPQFFPKLARRVALNVQRILLGEDAGEIPVEFSVRDRLLINMATARAIDVSPSWEILIEAEVLHAENIEGAYDLTMEKAVREAVEVNMDLVVRRTEVDAGAEEIARARSSLRPQLDASAAALEIDADRAAASFGSQAESSTTGSLALTQLVFSDAASGNVAIQRHLQEARTADLETLRLDIALQAATTYLNLMRAKALERVQRNNVDRTKSNLELAEIRRDLGVASAGEILRWESQVATARKQLIDAVATRRSAEIAVNRLLHRRQESPFIAEEVTLETRGLGASEGRFRRFVETPRRYQLVRDFLVIEGLSRSPELRRLDAAIAAQGRFVDTARRAFWAPTVALRGAYDEIFSKSGAGSEAPTGVGFALPTVDDSSWSLALNATLPIFSGGARFAELHQAELDLEALQLERTAVEEKLEQRIRTALEEARSSFIGIRLTGQAAKAARGNLELVEDSYARGVASLLDLLDAQTNALNAEEQAASALYEFLIDLLEAQRAANAIEFLVTEDERDQSLERLVAYLAIREAEDSE